MRNRRPRNNTVRSTCGDVVLRGTDQQLIEKYKTLADECSDETQKQQYLQQVEHYTRKVNENVTLRTTKI